MSRLGQTAEVAGSLNAVAIERLPIDNFMPPEGVEFRNMAAAGLPAQGASATVLAFRVPKGYNGIINRLGIQFVGGGFQEGQGLVTYTLYIDSENAIPAPGFQRISFSQGTPNTPVILNGIRIKENQLVAIVVSNANPGVVPAGQSVGALLGGYYYPVALEPAQITF